MLEFGLVCSVTRLQPPLWTVLVRLSEITRVACCGKIAGLADDLGQVSGAKSAGL